MLSMKVASASGDVGATAAYSQSAVLANQGPRTLVIVVEKGMGGNAKNVPGRGESINQ